MENKKYGLLVKYIILTLLLLISAINFNLLMRPMNFVTGGTPGLAITLEEITNIASRYIIYGIYVIMFVVCLLILGKKASFGILYATILYPLFVTLTYDINNYIVITYDDFFLICLLSGVISGLANGFIYRLGFASSGIATLGPIFNKCFHMSIAYTNFFVNVIIVLMGGYLFGIEMVLYAIIFLYLNSFIANRIILGVSTNKAVMVCSKKNCDIYKMLYEKYHIEAIIEDSLEKTIMFVLPIFRYNQIIDNIKTIDKDVFYNVLDCYECDN